MHGQLEGFEAKQINYSEVVPGALHPRLVGGKGDLDLGTLFAAGVLG